MNGLPYDKDGNYPGHVCRKGHLTTNTKSSLAGQPQKDTASWLKKQVPPLAHPACKRHLWFFSFVLALARCSRNWPWPQHSLQQGHVIAAAKYTHENAERCAHPPYHALHSRRLTRSQSDSSSPNPCQSIHVRNYAGAGPSFEMAAIDLSCGGCAAERPLRLTRLSYRCNDPTLSSMQRGRRQRGIATESLTLSVPTAVCVGGTRSSQRRDVHARSEERARACVRARARLALTCPASTRRASAPRWHIQLLSDPFAALRDRHSRPSRHESTTHTPTSGANTRAILPPCVFDPKIWASSHP